MKRNFTKILAAFALLVFMVPSLVAWGQTRTEKTYDFSQISGFSDWGTSYNQHVVEYEDATVTFASANHQTSTITDIPVTKGQPVSLVLNEATNSITSATFVCRQWGTKAQTITLHYSTDGGQSYTSTGVTSTNFTISSNSLPEGTNAVKITFNNTSNQVGIASATINFEESSSSAVATQVTIDASGITNTDVYTSTEAGLLSATVTETVSGDEVEGATVTWSGNNDAVATINASTGVVTLVSMGTVTFTASYAGVENEYLPSSDTYEMTVLDSRYETSTLEFTAACGGTGTADDGAEWTITSDASESIFDSNSGIHYGTNNASVTYVQLTTSDITGVVKKVVVNARDAQACATITVTVGGTSFACTGSATATNTSADYTFVGTGSGEIVVRIDRGEAMTKAIYVKRVVVVYEPDNTPSFTISNNDELEYDATGGSFNFTVNHAVTGGTTSVAEEVDWISNAAISGNTVTFTTTVNDAAASREGIIALTYTYNRETITENVTVSQAGNPNTPVNISSINAAGNYVVQGTIVAISNRGFVLGDGTGYIYYYKGSDFNTSEYSIGDKVKLSGAVTASTQYKVFQFGSETEITPVTESNYVAENPTTITGAQMDAIVSSSNTTVTLSNYVQYEGILSVSTNNNNTYYNITNISGATTAKGSISYPTNTDFASLDGKTVKVTGYFVGVSSSQYYNTMIGSIEEIVIPVIIANDKTLDYDATEGEIEYSITNGTGPVSAEVTGGDWLTMGTITATTVPFTCSVNDGNTDRTVTITLSYTGATDKVITVTQGHFVADYATLPFEFDGGRADIANTAGLTQEHLGTDYSSSPKLKFNNDNSTISTLVLKINETPGTLSFDIKGNSFSGGTFKVQTSVDGETYTDLKTYTELGDKQSEVFNNLAADVRYIKWVYTEKSSGNVALGNIALAKPLTLTVNGYGTSTDGGYVLVASPVSTTPVAAGMITANSNYDLYYFDDTQAKEWVNYKAEDYEQNGTVNPFNLVPGTGYLYANSANVTLTFTGTPYDGNGEFTVPAGWHLLGNPFAETAYIGREFYTMNSNGNGLIASTNVNDPIDAMHGVFVKATAEETVAFSTTAPGKNSESVVLNVMKNRGNVIDRAIVRFDEGQQLPKFQLNPNSTKIYVTEGNQDFAVVRSAAEGEMPVSFKASENGTYTLAVETENVEMDYLHLIDNMTGADVDLLATPNYTFEARTNDYTSRFRLVFSAEENGASDSATFAYYNGTSWTVSNTGDATLQVVDITGRIVSSETINGNATVSLNQPAGIYMLRLVNGNDVKVQKVVVR